jgi:hypothetical protein
MNETILSSEKSLLSELESLDYCKCENPTVMDSCHCLDSSCACGGKIHRSIRCASCKGILQDRITDVGQKKIEEMRQEISMKMRNATMKTPKQRRYVGTCVGCGQAIYDGYIEDVDESDVCIEVDESGAHAVDYTRKKDMNHQIFMGNGNVSGARCYSLIQSLVEAFSLLGVIQQPIHWDHEPTPAEKSIDEAKREAMEYEIEHTARNIAEALTGKKVVFRDRDDG